MTVPKITGAATHDQRGAFHEVLAIWGQGGTCCDALKKRMPKTPVEILIAASELGDSRAIVVIENGIVSGHVIGKANAPLTMVEFTDLQCPFCRQFHLTVFDEIKRDWIETGRLRYISRDFPLDAIHPLAIRAAKAARCAGEQEEFWEMRHEILLNNQRLNAPLMTTLAGDLHLDRETFGRCLDASSQHDADIRKDVADGTSIGVSGTPSFVIGRMTATGLEGVLVVGAQPYTTFDARLKELMQS